MKLLLRYLIFLFLLCNIPSNAQEPEKFPDSTQSIQVELLTGDVFNGFVLKRDSQKIHLFVEGIGELELDYIDIRYIQPKSMTKLILNEEWFDNPNATRHFFGPTGYGLKKGEGYYQNIWVLLNSVNFGITDYFSLGGGIEAISTLTGHPLLFVTPKFSIPVARNLNLGLGTILGTIFIEDSGFIGITYGVLTYGNIENNITVGSGFGFVDGEWTDRPILTISGMTRISKKWALITENWIIPADAYTGVIGLGARWMTPGVTIDFGLITHPDIVTEILGIPYLDFVIPLNRK